jgi:catechol 2,3-dioxygenase-like lactoylglutathione lyase family enzyme
VAVPGARVRGLHLALPGPGPDGPTLEIFEYEPPESADPPVANRPGFGHIAFSVQDVEGMHRRVISAGGKALGKIVSKSIAGSGVITFAYLRDPEGNILELQRWTEA